MTALWFLYKSTPDLGNTVSHWFFQDDWTAYSLFLIIENWVSKDFLPLPNLKPYWIPFLQNRHHLVGVIEITSIHIPMSLLKAG